MDWQIYTFKQLSLDLLYELIQLRINVFVVEQDCPYRELDDKDKLADTLHLIGFNERGKMLAYARLLAPNVSFPEASIGRILVVKENRGKGIARQLVNQGINITKQTWSDSNIQIGAQRYLQHFYESIGFQINSEVYLEDGISHINMIYRC